jgi:CPA1 family monovalent cation:H+ antiporter
VLWGQLAFLLESIAFLFVGLELPSTVRSMHGLSGLQFVVLVLLTVTVLVLTRALFVTAVRLVTPPEQRTGRRTALVIIWAGARGPVSVLAAFTIPVLLDDGSPFPARQEILAVTFGVVVVTLLLSLTLGPLVRRLGFEPEDDAELLERARDRAAAAAIARLDSLVADARSDGVVVPESLVAGLRGAILVRRRINRRSQRLTDTYLDWRREMLEAERLELQAMRDEGDLPDPVMRDLLREIDVREAAVGPSD